MYRSTRCWRWLRRRAARGRGDRMHRNGICRGGDSGEGEVGEGVPLVRTAGGGGRGLVLVRNLRTVASSARMAAVVNVGGGDVRVAGEDELGVLERAGKRASRGAGRRRLR